MRDIAVTLFFIVIAAAALKRPFYGALLWVLFGLMNPHRLAYGFAYSLPFAQMAVLITVGAAIYHSKLIRRPRGVPITLLVIFLCWMLVTTIFSMVPDPSWQKYVDVLKVIGMTLVIASLIRTREEIVGLVWVIVLSMGYFGSKGGVFTILTGGSFRVWGPPGSLVNGNNELAVALIMTIPLIYFLTANPLVAKDFHPARKLPEKWIRIGGFIGMLLCAVAALGSQSRGALLAILSMCSVLWWRSHSKVSMGLIVIIGIVFALPLLPDSWFDRMNSIQTYEEDLSALQRLNAWETAINIANDRITGAGFATAHPTVFGAYSPRPGSEWVYVAHSIYFQVIGDHGYIGFAIYLMFWLSVYFGSARIASKARAFSDLDWMISLMNLCRVTLVGFAVGGAFLSLAYWDMPYYIMVIVVACGMLVQGRIAESRLTIETGRRSSAVVSVSHLPGA